jgi:hypothetical protein
MKIMKTMHVKKAILILVTLVVILTPAMAAEAGNKPYLTVVGAVDSDVYLFNEQGVYMPPSDTPAQLREGWIVLSGQNPVTLSGNDTTVVLQKESILTLGSLRSDEPSFYLVGGSASFYLEEPFSGTCTVSTPVGIYELNGSGEMFVSSDYAELIFSLGGEIRVMNTITRSITDIPPYTYLNLADPFLNPKQLSRQTYETLSIRPASDRADLLPSATVEDGITFQAPKPLFPVTEVSKAVEEASPEATLSIPVQISDEKRLVSKDIMISEVPSEGMSVTVSIEANRPPQGDAESEETPVLASDTPDKETYSVYVVHTNDMRGQIDREGNINVAQLATLLDWGRNISERNLLLDAGNTLSGHPVTDAFTGETVAMLLDMLGYDAIAPGPDDYAFGFARLREAAELASQFSDIKVLAANILDASGNQVFEPYGLFDLKGYTIGVIGLSIPPKSLQDEVTFLSDEIIANAQALVDSVAEKSDFVIVLGNLGTSSDITASEIASTLSGIDLIIDGSEAQLPENGRFVGETLLVHADAELESVGVVEIQVIDGEAQALYATRIHADDINHPEQSALATQYGITSIPEKPEVRTYIDQQQASLVAEQGDEQQKTEAKAETPVEVLQEGEEPTVTEEPSADKALTIREPLGIVSSDEEPVGETFDWGIKTTMTLSRVGGSASGVPSMGISVNPFFHRNSFEMGLQAFFMTEGSLFTPNLYTYSNFSDETGIAGTVSTAMHFIDYLRYGEIGYPFHLSLDDHTPISFGNRIMVNRMGVASGPEELHLGAYSSVQLGKFGLEVFGDDLYLYNWLEVPGGKQIGGGRLSYTAGSRFTFALSSVASITRSRVLTAYPAFDFNWTLKDERRLKIDTFMGLATKLSVNDPALDTIYDASGTTFDERFPNFLVAVGMDVRTLKWKFRLASAIQNDTDPILSYGSLNQTRYSGQRLVADDTGIYTTFATEASYRSNLFGFSFSYDIPVLLDFSAVAVTEDNNQVTADRFAVEATYQGNTLEAAIGLRRIGMLSAMQNLFENFSVTTLYQDFIRSTSLQKASEPYFSLRFNRGLFGIFGDIALVHDSGSNYTPRVDLGATITLGKNAVADYLTEKSVLAKSSDFSISMHTAYTRRFAVGTDEHYLTIAPQISYSPSPSFSFGIAPQMTFDVVPLSLYAQNDSQFTFGSSYLGTFGQLYDTVTDAFALVDHLRIGSPEDTFHLEISRDQQISMGPLVQEVTTNTDGYLETPLALYSAVDTRVFDMNLFVNDLTDPSLGGIRFAIAPFRSYAAEFGLSALGVPRLTNAGKSLVLLPGFDTVLPLISGKKTTLDAKIHAVSLVGYSTLTGFSQHFYADSGNFTDRFQHYLVSGTLDLNVGDISLAVDVAMQDGALSYGMFNTLLPRELGQIMDDLDLSSLATDARSYTIGASAGIEKESFSLFGSYALPFSTAFAPDYASDLLTVRGKLDLSWFSVELAYSRRGFADAAQTLIGSSAALTSRVRNFLFDQNSAISAGISMTQGPLTFSAIASSLASYTTSTVWNQPDVVTVAPALTLTVDINLL